MDVIKLKKNCYYAYITEIFEVVVVYAGCSLDEAEEMRFTFYIKRIHKNNSDENNLLGYSLYKKGVEANIFPVEELEYVDFQ